MLSSTDRHLLTNLTKSIQVLSTEIKNLPKEIKKCTRSMRHKNPEDS